MAQRGAKTAVETKEQRFFRVLRDLFVGAKVEGESGFVNLMRIKSRYYEQGVFRCLKEDIDRALQPFPEFREELFDRLYTFFRRYFSESGSIYFRFTPPHEHVYEKVYTDDRDVALFWKTHMLYYVKTDRLFQNMEVELDGFRFYFDVSELEHKRANEKRTLVYTFKERRQDGTLVFRVSYSERGRQTDLDAIRRAIRDALGLKQYTSAVPSEETLERSFRLFERQSEVDYFINKNARQFLREQFNLWLYQYVFEPEARKGTLWTDERIQQLQVLKEIAYKIIDFIGQFEDELVKIWNKPKFVLDSHYVITLDRIVAQAGGEAVLERLFAHPGMEKQVREWRELGIVGEDFTLEEVLIPPPESFLQPDLFAVAKERGLIMTGYHLPYNPDLVERARELRKHMTPAETKLWRDFLRHFKYPVLRQRPIDHFIVDFYCPALRLVIEIDGEQHYTEEGKAYDAERDAILQGYGLCVLRFRNEEVLNHFDQVCAAIEAGSPLTPDPLSPLTKGGEGQGSGGIISRSEKAQGNLVLNPRYRYLPIDTKHFPDLEVSILALFDDLDQALDGWLVHSENYQALNTMLRKFEGRVQTIYIDPPFNKEQDADYFYSVKYKDATWITMLENRIRLGRMFLNDKGSIFVRCDYNGNMYVRMLLNEVFGEENFRNEIVVNRFQKSSGGLTNTTENLFLYSKTQKMIINHLVKTRTCIYCKQPISPRWTWAHSAGESKEPRYFVVDGQRVLLYPPKGRHWTNSQEELDKLHAEGRIRINKNAYYVDVFGNRVNFIPEKLQSDNISVDNNWTDIPGYEFGVFSQWKFPTENSEILLKRVIESTSNESDLIMDFFLGSGTTTAVAHKLGRKWIGIEMGEHFYSVVLPRMKKVLAYDKSGISKEKDVKEKYNEKSAGGFFKYFRLESYEEVLRKARYRDDDAPLFYEDPYTQYVFLRDPKMLDNAETGKQVVAVDMERGEIRVNLENLYPGGSPLTPDPLSPLTKRGEGQESGGIFTPNAEYQGSGGITFSDSVEVGSPLTPDPLSPLPKGGEGQESGGIISHSAAGQESGGITFAGSVELESPLTPDPLSPLPKGGAGQESGGIFTPNTEYQGSGKIDLAETLSCLTGKWIRRIHPDKSDATKPGEVEFEDGTVVDLQNPPWELVKPLIWW